MCVDFKRSYEYPGCRNRVTGLIRREMSTTLSEPGDFHLEAQALHAPLVRAVLVAAGVQILAVAIGWHMYGITRQRL